MKLKILLICGVAVSMTPIIGCKGEAKLAPTEPFDVQPYLSQSEAYSSDLQISIGDIAYALDADSIATDVTNDDGLKYDEQILFDCCKAIASIHSKNSIDATIELTGQHDTPYIITQSEQGMSVQADDLMAIFMTDKSNDVECPYEIIEPKKDTETLKQLNTLLSSYKTSFDKSNLSKENRVFNIKKAAESINGTVIEPDEVFSTNKTIGDRNRENGWKKAAAISGGTYVEEYGGGVCQVSSTLFNAVLMADLEIVERYHHSWPMSYVPIGRDATISTGIKDFRFRNTTDAPITILANVDEDNKEIEICIYGKQYQTHAYIVIESEKVGYVDSLPNEYRLDEDLPNGTEVVEREGRRGRKSVTYKLYYKADGTLIEKVVAFKDTYPSISSIIYRSADLFY